MSTKVDVEGHVQTLTLLGAVFRFMGSGFLGPPLTWSQPEQSPLLHKAGTTESVESLLPSMSCCWVEP